MWCALCCEYDCDSHGLAYEIAMARKTWTYVARIRTLGDFRQDCLRKETPRKRARDDASVSPGPNACWQLRYARIKKLCALAVCPMQEERLCRNFELVCVAGPAHRGRASPLQAPAAVSLDRTEREVKRFLPRMALLFGCDRLKSSRLRHGAEDLRLTDASECVKQAGCDPKRRRTPSTTRESMLWRSREEERFQRNLLGIRRLSRARRLLTAGGYRSHARDRLS
jgi:hypothetical protein